MNLDAIAEKLYKELHTPWLGDKAVIRAALAQVRDETLEEGARWHDEQADELRKTTEEARAKDLQFTADIFENDVEIHVDSAAALRAMKEPT